MRVLARWSLLFTVLPLVSGCALPYYWQAASGHLDLLRKRTPIEAVLEDPSQPPDVKQALRRVVDMRAFAIDELGLPDSRSYQSYVDLTGRTLSGMSWPRRSSQSIRCSGVSR